MEQHEDLFRLATEESKNELFQMMGTKSTERGLIEYNAREGFFLSKDGKIGISLFVYQKQRNDDLAGAISLHCNDEQGLYITSFILSLCKDGFAIEKFTVYEDDIASLMPHVTSYEGLDKSVHGVIRGINAIEARRQDEKREGITFVSEKEIRDVMILLQDAVPEAPPKPFWKEL